MTKYIQNIPPEIRCKIYKHCDTTSLLNARTHDNSIDDHHVDEWTPLHFAAFNDNVDSARILVELGADKSLTDRDDYTPHDIAESSSGSDEIKNILR
jgi:ankyrin repeat protein